MSPIFSRPKTVALGVLALLLATSATTMAAPPRHPQLRGKLVAAGHRVGARPTAPVRMNALLHGQLARAQARINRQVAHHGLPTATKRAVQRHLRTGAGLILAGARVLTPNPATPKAPRPAAPRAQVQAAALLRGLLTLPHPMVPSPRPRPAP